MPTCRHAQEQVDRDREDPGFQRDIARCEKRPNRYGAASATECAQMMGPRVEWYISRPQLSLAEAQRNQGLAVFVFLTGLLMLAATTFVGADWNSGSMSNQLLFEPRRIRIWLAKAGSVMALAALTLGLVLTAFWGAVYLLARSRDLEPLARVIDDIQGTTVRAHPSGRGRRPGGVRRHDAVPQHGLHPRRDVRGGGRLHHRAGGARASPSAGCLTRTWPRCSTTAPSYYREVPDICFSSPRPPAGPECQQFGTVTLGDGALYLGIALALAVVLSIWSFQRRDVP